MNIVFNIRHSEGSNTQHLNRDNNMKKKSIMNYLPINEITFTTLQLMWCKEQNVK